MNKPVCARCDGTDFKNAEITPQGSNFKLSITFCYDCGAPVGLMDHFNIGKLIQHQEKQIAALQKDVSEVKDVLDRLLVVMARQNRQ